MMAVALLASPLLLEVPFVAQREDGCAAAALTMVLRYWGDPAPEDELTAALPERDDTGVAGSRLVEVARKRGHEAVAYRGDMEHLREQLGKGRPLIVALGAGRRRFHDVVVIGFDDQGRAVVVNDPERGASRRLPARTFEKQWAESGYWTLLVLPATP
jgi:ABC-type bacteriocin/lantibiotic exporter with double-glycine peptidase domain